MIIDCHGHYTTAPEAHTAWRQAGQQGPYPVISDDEIRESLEGNQLRLMDERGIDTRPTNTRNPGPMRLWSRHRRSIIAAIALTALPPPPTKTSATVRLLTWAATSSPLPT